MNLKDWLLPKEKIFFTYLEEQVDNVVVGADCLQKLTTDYCDVGLSLKQMKKIEHHGDQIVHRFYQKLNQTFITPIDQEDLTTLFSVFDDILDRMYSVVNRLYLYRITEIPPEIGKFVHILVCQLSQIKKAAFRIRKMAGSEIDQCCIEIHRLENTGDQLYDRVSADLFLRENDLKTIIKLREIYSLLEEAIDKSEDAALAIHQVITKNI
ncbi:MAG: DUF47 family protein [Candidatus Shapirobacteria bacterium]|jgi:hypothetical protein